MLKRIGMIALVSVVTAGMVPAAEAHWVPTFSGWAYHSVQCSLELKSVPNPDAHPAIVECVVRTQLIESLCVVPGNDNLVNGSSGLQVTLAGQTPVDPSNITDKKKGKAFVAVTVGSADGNPNDPPLDNAFCVNPNWTNVANLIRAFETEINTYRCGDDACTPGLVSLVSTVQAQCTLPSGFNFEDATYTPDENDETFDVDCPNCPDVGDKYDCPDPVSAHVD